MEIEPVNIDEVVKEPVVTHSRSNATIDDKPTSEKSGEMSAVDAVSSKNDFVQSDDNLCGTVDQTGELSDQLCEPIGADILGAQANANKDDQSSLVADDSASATLCSEKTVSGLADSSCEIIENSCEPFDGNIGGTQMLADQRKQLESVGINTTTVASSGETLVTVQTRPLSPESISK